MDYTYIAPPEKANPGWMGHHVKLFVDQKNREEFWAFLENYCGPRGEQWRTSKKQERWIWGDVPIELRFMHKKHAMVVKLQWVEDENPMDRIYREMAALSKSFKTFMPQNQSMGRGVRNAHVTCTKPAANPLPWYNQTYPQMIDYSGLLRSGLVSRKHVAKTLGLSGKDYDSILLDDYSEKPTEPVWSIAKCRERGDEISTTAMIEARLAGSTSLPALYEVRPEERRDSGSDRTSG